MTFMTFLIPESNQKIYESFAYISLFSYMTRIIFVNWSKISFAFLAKYKIIHFFEYKKKKKIRIIKKSHEQSKQINNN